MATEHREYRPVRSEGDIVERVPEERQTDSRSFGELLKELANDVSQLVRAEVALAKNEFRQMAKDVMTDSMWVAVAAGLALAGGLLLLAGFVVLLGDTVFGDNYWLPALLVGALLVLIGGIVAYSKAKDISSDAEMDTTIQNLKTDARFAKSEAREFKEEIQDGSRRRHVA